MKKITKAKYPEKTSINLAMTEVEPGNSKKTLVGFGIFLVALVVFVKFAVLDPMSKAWAKEAAYNSIQSEMNQMTDSLKDYDSVAEEYSKYSNGYMNEEELLITDRKDALDLMESQVLGQADVQSVEIAGNTMTIVLSETDLATVSRVVASLQSDERTYNVNVTTAASGNSSDKSQLVTANIIVTLAGADAAATDGTTEAGGDVQ